MCFTAAFWKTVLKPQQQQQLQKKEKGGEMGSHPAGRLCLTSSLTSADPALQRDTERRNSPADRLLIKVTVGGQEAAGVRAAVWRGGRAESRLASLSGNPVKWVQTHPTPAHKVCIRGLGATVRWNICLQVIVFCFKSKRIITIVAAGQYLFPGLLFGLGCSAQP